MLLEIAGAGVLLSGASGIGKSETALELISRGHRLVADDAPRFALNTRGRLIGRCPGVLRNVLAVRALGVLDIAALFGARAVAAEVSLDLIVRLERGAADDAQALHSPAPRPCSVLGVEIPELTLHLAPGRNTALLVECLVRNYLLQQSGYDGARAFVERQRRALGAL